MHKVFFGCLQAFICPHVVLDDVGKHVIISRTGFRKCLLQRSFLEITVEICSYSISVLCNHAIVHITKLYSSKHFATH